MIWAWKHLEQHCRKLRLPDQVHHRIQLHAYEMLVLTTKRILWSVNIVAVESHPMEFFMVDHVLAPRMETPEEEVFVVH